MVNFYSKQFYSTKFVEVFYFAISISHMNIKYFLLNSYISLRYRWKKFAIVLLESKVVPINHGGEKRREKKMKIDAKRGISYTCDTMNVRPWTHENLKYCCGFGNLKNCEKIFSFG